METTDKTLLEMQQQMQQLREKLESQKIINDQMLRNSYRQNTRRLKLKSRLLIMAALVGVAFLPCLHNLGYSVPFLVFTGVLFAISMIAEGIIGRLIPDMDKDLVTATENLIRYRKINKDWIKYGIPALVVWLGLFILDSWKNTYLFDNDLVLPLGIGMIIGLTVGLILGLRNRSIILHTSDELLDQIEQLKH